MRPSNGYVDAKSTQQFCLLCHKARYAKLGWQVGKMKVIVQKTADIAPRHFRTFTRLKIVVDEVVRRKDIIQKVWDAFRRIGSYAQNICITTSVMCCEPCLTEVWPNIRHKDVTRSIESDCPRRRQRR